jgi:hypothetical protein
LDLRVFYGGAKKKNLKPAFIRVGIPLKVTRIGRYAKLCAALSLLIFSDGVAEKSDKVSYWDIFSLQIDRRDSWAIENLGFNLSRYFEISNNNRLIFPGVGIRAKVGENPKIELFPKLAIAGLAGGKATQLQRMANETACAPYSHQFNPADLGHHVFRLRESRAGAFGSLLLRRRDRSPSPVG